MEGPLPRATPDPQLAVTDTYAALFLCFATLLRSRSDVEFGLQVPRWCRACSHWHMQASCTANGFHGEAAVVLASHPLPATSPFVLRLQLHNDNFMTTASFGIVPARRSQCAPGQSIKIRARGLHVRVLGGMNGAGLAAWQQHPPSMLALHDTPQPSGRIAAFDLDGTLVRWKARKKFSLTADGWLWWSDAVPYKLQVRGAMRMCLL